MNFMIQYYVLDSIYLFSVFIFIVLFSTEVIYNYKKLLRMMKTTSKISEAIRILILSKDEKSPVISVGSRVKKEVIETFMLS